MLAGNQLQAAEVSESAVVNHYAKIAHAVYEDSLITALNLEQVVDQFLKSPSEDGLKLAKSAWRRARIPYQQSEVFRFGNPVVDDWEGQLNAWPLDEGLIDYVAMDDYHHEMGNPGATANIVASTSLRVGGKDLDLKKITPKLLASLNELGGSEANVATGYHAIEFLLWGQDLNGSGPGAGNRPYTDFVVGEGCTGGHCFRRREYLRAAIDLLVDDLKYMEKQWQPSVETNYRAELQSDPTAAIQKMLFGMGSLALGELAGERIKVALEANSTEDEHDCFSDNTHFSHYYNAKGVWNVYHGKYTRIDKSKVFGPSLAHLVKQKDRALAKETKRQFKQTMAAMKAIVKKAEAEPTPMKFDQMIAEGNSVGEQTLTASIDGLVALTEDIEAVAILLGIDDLAPDNADHSF